MRQNRRSHNNKLYQEVCDHSGEIQVTKTQVTMLEYRNSEAN